MAEEKQTMEVQYASSGEILNNYWAPSQTYTSQFLKFRIFLKD